MKDFKLFWKELEKLEPYGTTWRFHLVWAIYYLYYNDIYPSASKINIVLQNNLDANRKRRELNGRECKLRTKIFNKLGIKKRKN